MANISESAQVSPDDSAAQGAAKLFYYLWSAAFEHADETRDGDADALHDLRVDLRRLRTAMSNFEGPKNAPLLSKSLRLEIRGARAAIGKLGDKLGAVRDFDVLEDYVRDYARKQLKTEIDAAPGLAHLLETLEFERARAFKPMRKALAKAGEGDGLREEFGRWALGLPAAKSNPILMGEAAQLILQARLDEVFEHQNALLEGAAEAEQHELRKSLRRARYSLETLAVCLQKPVKPFVKTLVEMQDTLGEMQDRAVLLGVVTRVFGEEKRPADVAQFLAHGEKRRRYLLGQTRTLWKASQTNGFWDELRAL